MERNPNSHIVLDDNGDNVSQENKDYIFKHTGLTYEELRLNEYEHITILPNGKVAVLLRFLFTWAIVTSISRGSYRERYCFTEYCEAVGSLMDWDGYNKPPGTYVDKSII